MTSLTISSLLEPASVLPSLRAHDLTAVIQEMTRLAAEVTRLDHPSLQNAVIARSETSSLAMGRGVALPHAMIAGLDGPLGVFARLDPALECDTPDGAPIDLVMLIVSPEEDEATLLRSLACAARRLRDREVSARLRSAANAEALHIVLTSDAWRGHLGGAVPYRAKHRTAMI